MINYMYNDTKTDSVRTVMLAHPLYSSNETFYGMLFWEIPFATIFNSDLLPQSFYSSNFSMM